MILRCSLFSVLFLVSATAFSQETSASAQRPRITTATIQEYEQQHMTKPEKRAARKLARAEKRQQKKLERAEQKQEQKTTKRTKKYKTVNCYFDWRDYL